MRDGTTEKLYLALVCGTWNLGHKHIELALATGASDAAANATWPCAAMAEMAVSTLRPVQFFGNVASLMEVAIDTGKTHADPGFTRRMPGTPWRATTSIVVMAKRSAVLRQYGLNRMFLHAASIGVNRPGTHDRCT